MQDNDDQNTPGQVFRPNDEENSFNSSLGPNPAEQAAAVEPEASQPDVLAEPPQQILDEHKPHVAWSASEYIANPKSAGWFSMLAVASLVLAAVVFLITRDIVSTVVILILGLTLGIFGARQPQVLNYAIDNTGIHVGNKFYDYGSFKWFSVVNDHGMGYIYLMPLRRFLPPLTIHYDPSDEDKIAETLSEYMPYENHKPDIVDDITRRFRF